MTTVSGGAPSIMASASSAARAPSSRSGWCTVVIPGLYWEARRWSSKPTTETSPGNVPPGLAQGLDGADDVRWSLTGPDGSCARGTAADSAPSTVRVPDAVTWNPESPALYDLLMEMRDDDGARTAGAPRDRSLTS